MEYASAGKARPALIAGQKEIKENEVRFRDLKTGEEGIARLQLHHDLVVVSQGSNFQSIVRLNPLI